MSATDILYGPGMSRQVSDQTRLVDFIMLKEDIEVAAEGLREETQTIEDIPGLFFQMLEAEKFPHDEKHQKDVASVIARMARWLDGASALQLEDAHPRIIEMLAYAPAIPGQKQNSIVSPIYERLVLSYLKYYRAAEKDHSSRVDAVLKQALERDDYQPKSYLQLVEPNPQNPDYVRRASTGHSHLIAAGGTEAIRFGGKTACGVAIPGRHGTGRGNKQWRDAWRTEDKWEDYWQPMFREYHPDPELIVEPSCTRCAGHADSEKVVRRPLNEHEQLRHTHRYVRQTVPKLFAEQLGSRQTPEELERNLQQLIWEQSLLSIRSEDKETIECLRRQGLSGCR